MKTKIISKRFGKSYVDEPTDDDLNKAELLFLNAANDMDVYPNILKVEKETDNSVWYIKIKYEVL